MEDLAAQTKRWVRAGHLTEAQRDAILASESAAGRPSAEAKAMSLMRTGPRAEVFVAGMGGLVALVAALVMASIDGADLGSWVLPAGVLALTGLTLLFGIRGGSVLADVAFAGCMWLLAAAAVEVDDQVWRFLAPYAAVTILLIGVLRLTRFVIAVPAVALAFVYVTGAFPDADEMVILVGYPIVLFLAAAVLYALRSRVAALAERVRRGRAKGAGAEHPAQGTSD